MSPNWRKQKNKYFESEMAFARKFDPEVTKILKTVLSAERIEIADKPDDCEHNTDYLAFRHGISDPLRIAGRVRRSTALKYNNITLRSDLANNRIKHEGDTELQKMCAGWGDLDFYAIASEDETHLVYWVISDLDKLRNIVEWGGLEEVRRKEARNTGCGFIPVPLDVYGAIIETDSTEWGEIS